MILDVITFIVKSKFNGSRVFNTDINPELSNFSIPILRNIPDTQQLEKGILLIHAD
jgi:hypothetical protein